MSGAPAIPACQCGASAPLTSSSANSLALPILEQINGELPEATEDATVTDTNPATGSGSKRQPNQAAGKTKAATLDGSAAGLLQRHQQFNQQLNQSQLHHPDCSYAISNQLARFKRRGSAKLQPSPSSASSHSNTSSLFRDDGFEDDLMSTGSEHLSSSNASSSAHQHHRLSFQGSRSQINLIHAQLSSMSLRANRTSNNPTSSNHTNSSSNNNNNSNTNQQDDDDQQSFRSCEEKFTNTTATSASTTSNFDDCALSTSSSSIVNQAAASGHQVLDKVTLANAKQQYRKSLLLEHHQYTSLQQREQQQHQQQQQLTSHQNFSSRIQALATPNLSHLHLLRAAASSNQNVSGPIQAASATGSNSPLLAAAAAAKHQSGTKCDDRTVNIIGHMPTKSPGYWDSNLSITQRVVTEIIETERTYVDDLEQIVTGYICYLRNVLKQQKQQQQQHQQHHVIVLEKTAPPPTSTTTNEMVNGKSSSSPPVTSFRPFEGDKSADQEIDDDDEDDEDDDEENDLSHRIESSPETRLCNEEKQSQPKRSAPVNEKDPKKSTPSSTINHTESNLSSAIITGSDIKKLFSNLEDIYKFNKDLLFRLEECYLNPSSVAECFVENSSGFEVYTNYCTMYPQVVTTLTELMANPKSAQLLKERQNELSHCLPLGSYLLKPVQRILKYHILFQSLIKHTSDDETINEKDRLLINEAFSVMTSIACHINSMKKRHEHAIRVQEVQGLLYGWNGPDLTTLGELILEDSFKLFNRSKSSRHLFLFDNVLLFTKKKRDGTLCYKGHIECSNLMLIEKIDGQPLVFNTVPFDNPKALHAFQAKNLDKKRDWCIQMKEVIIKSFEVKIPVHVRDILMGLTNCGSNLSGDSSNESSTTSTTTPTNGKQTKTTSCKSAEAARLLKAPNYLEKKRIKQQQQDKMKTTTTTTMMMMK